MGDRCYVSLSVHKDSRDAVMEAFGLPDYEDEPGSLQYDQVNYGGFDMMEALASRGAIFTGHSGPGLCYGSADFYSDAGQLHEWEAGHDGGLVLHKLIPGHIRAARSFLACLAKKNSIIQRSWL